MSHCATRMLQFAFRMSENRNIGSVGDTIGIRNWPVELECSVANCLILPRNSLESGKDNNVITLLEL